MIQVGMEDVLAAQKVLAQSIEQTRLIRNIWLSEEFDCDLYLKLENMHPIGSFKIRGATNKISSLSAAEKKRGVICASAGNHAQGVAWGARKLGVSAQVVMPEGAPLMKIQRTKALGAEVILEGATYEGAAAAARRICKETGRVYVHGFEDKHVVAGQGTIALEVLGKLPAPDYVFASFGGGGMIAGVNLVLQEKSPQTKVVGCHSSAAQKIVDAVQAGDIAEVDRVETFADGIAIAKPSKLLRPYWKFHRFLHADDETIAAAVLALIEKAKIVAEGSGALPLAVLEQMRGEIKGKKVVLIVSGGNIDVNILSRILDRGLTREGRRLRVNVLISDRPGSLHRLTKCIADAGASVLQVIHDRNEPWVRIDQTGVELTLETKGPKHADEIIQALAKETFRCSVVK